MKKKIIHRKLLVIVSIIFSLLQFGSCTKHNDLYKDSLNGRVKSVETIEYDNVYIEDGKIIKAEDDQLIKSFVTYDKSGNMISKKIYRDDNLLNFYKVLTDNNKLSIVEQGSSDDYKVKEVTNKKRGLRINTLQYENEEFNGEMKYYSEDGKLIIGIWKDRKGKYNGMMMTKNNKNNITEKIVLHVTQLNREYVEIFDSKTGRFVKSIVKKGNESEEYSVIYDDSGLVAKSINCIHDVHLITNHGHGYKNTYSYKYVFDKMNNWIECAVYVEGEDEPEIFKERKISYY